MSRYLEAKEMYAKWGIDTDKAIETLKSVPDLIPLLNIEKF